MSDQRPTDQGYDAIRQARFERLKQLTAELKQTNLVEVMTHVFNLAGDKSNRGAYKYHLGDGTLLNVHADEMRFYSLDDRKFESLKGLRRGSTAIDLVLAVSEANGAKVDFSEAVKILQRTFRPDTIEHAGARSDGGVRIESGRINLAAFYFKGNVIEKDGKYELVTSGWNDKERRNGAMRVVDCDEHGTPLKGAVERATSLEPEVYVKGKWETHGIMSVHRSAHPMIPDGMRSDDPALVLVPFGPFKGMMIGQLDENRLAELKTSAQSPALRAAIEATKPKTLKFVAKYEEKPRAAELEEIKPVDPQKMLRLGGKMIDNVKLVRDYIVARGFDSELVNAELARGAIVPTDWRGLKEDQLENKIEGAWLHEPAYGLHCTEYETGKLIGIQKKILFQDPEYARQKRGNDSHNYGHVPQGYMFLTPWTPNTTEAVFFEGYLKGLAYKQMRNPPETICLVALMGARVPYELIKDCAKRDAKLVAALDNDFTGRIKTQRTAEECERLGVRFEAHFPGLTAIVPGETLPLSEIELRLRENDLGRARAADAKNFLEAKRILYRELPEENGWLRLVIDNTPEASEFVWGYKVQDDHARSKDGRGKENKFVSVKWINKDWDDVLAGRYRRSFSKDEERRFQQQVPPDIPLAPEINAERNAIYKALEEATAGVGFTSEARKIFLALTADHLKAKGGSVDSLTVGELRQLSTEAASLHAEQLDRRMMREAPAAISFDPLLLVSDFQRLRHDYQKATAADRALIVKETERRAEEIRGPGTTGVALRVSAKEFVMGKEPIEKLTSRAVQHAGAIAEAQRHEIRSHHAHAHSR